jgi:hypothetical protein
MWIGSVNGGVWYTENATNVRPTWVNQTAASIPAIQSFSIGAIALDQLDQTFNRLVAGNASISSFNRNGGDRLGVIVTTDGGTSWRRATNSGLNGAHISGIAVRGDVVVVTVDRADVSSTSNIGVFRSTDFGESFTQVSVGDGSQTGLPASNAWDIVVDPQNSNRIFVALAGSNDGVYRSEDFGSSWVKVSDSAVDSALASINEIELAMGNSNNVYIAIAFGELRDLFRSGDGGTSWTALDIPSPTIHPGRQSFIHFSLAADPTDANLVYVGGDRQDFDAQTGNFPNEIGAVNFSGNIWRIDASLPPGSQAQHMTHSNSLGPTGGGTASDSSPHADSRDMAFDANGNLIESDDGGVYRRTSPQDNTGDWFSINGNLQITEIHGLAYDTVSNIVIGGTQDTGTGVQDMPGELPFTSISTGDGGDVAVDDVGSNEFSVRYSSFQNLQVFRRTVWDANNNFISLNQPSLTTTIGDPMFPAFYSALKTNNVEGGRLLFHVANGLYESLDEAETVQQVSTLPQPVNGGVSALDYGAVDNPNIIYVGGLSGRVEVRTGVPGSATTPAASFPGAGASGDVLSIALDPDQGNQAFALTSSNIYWTTNAGASWTEVTGNLFSLDVGTIRTVEYVNRAQGDMIVVGGRRGIYQALAEDNFSVWSVLGEGLPNVLVFELDYDAQDDLLLAGMLGQGAWSLDLGFQGELPCPGDFNDDQTVDQTDMDLINAAWADRDVAFDTNEDMRLNMLDLVNTLNLFGPCPTGSANASAATP